MDEFKDHPEMFKNDRLGLRAISEYYQYYFYERNDEMRYKVNKYSPIGRDDDLFNLLSVNTLSVSANQRVTNSVCNSFQTVLSNRCKGLLCDRFAYPGVVVPYGPEGEEIVNDLCGVSEIEKQYKLIKRAQRYTVNLLPFEFKLMAKRMLFGKFRKGQVFCTWIDNTTVTSSAGMMKL